MLIISDIRASRCVSLTDSVSDPTFLLLFCLQTHAAFEIDHPVTSSSRLPACRKISSVAGSRVVVATQRVVMFTDEVTAG